MHNGAKIMFSVPIMTMSQKKPMDAMMGPDIAGPYQVSHINRSRKKIKHAKQAHILQAPSFGFLKLNWLAPQLKNILGNSQGQ